MLFLHFFHYFYIPTSGPWYGGNVWGNVFVVTVLAPLTWLWSRTKFWPLRPVEAALRHLHGKVDDLDGKHAHTHDRLDIIERRLEDLHQKHDELHHALTSGTGGEASNLAGEGSTPSGGTS